MPEPRLIQMDNLGRLNKGRLWVNQLPFRIETQAKVFAGSFESPHSISASAFQLCLELKLMPRDANYYGLLGFEFTPTSSKTSFFEITYLERLGNFLNDNILSFKLNEVHIGIPKEFVEPIAGALQEMNEKLELPVGKYSFITSAHGEVGSSGIVYRKIVSILFLLVSKNAITFDSETLKSIIANELK